MLADAHDAYAARALLARAAQRTLDVQYYIWRNDTTGHLLLDELLLAADRGVRVRLLWTMAAPAAWTPCWPPWTSIRNRGAAVQPFALRTPKAIGYVTDFARTQRRMHNKSYTADSAATIVGGRNIGDEYFAASDGVLFADLDVVATGSVVSEVAAEFDRYWNSPSAYPAASLLPAMPQQAVDKVYAGLHADVNRPNPRPMCRPSAAAASAPTCWRVDCRCNGPRPPWSATTRPRSCAKPRPRTCCCPSSSR
jgi:putative cardiolipin synthase